jgi:hypothetical protein
VEGVPMRLLLSFEENSSSCEVFAGCWWMH